MLPSEVHGKRCRGIDYKGCASDYKAVRFVYELYRITPCIRRERFSVKRYVRSYDAAADMTFGNVAFSREDSICRVFLVASLAVITKSGTVYFLYVDASCLLVKPVYVLRDDAVELACFLHLCKLVVSSIRLYALYV